MNDFTKEELSLCYRAIEYMLYKEIWIQQESNKLKEKIRSMLASYCDHEPHGDFHVCVDKCRKCGVIVNE